MGARCLSRAVLAGAIVAAVQSAGAHAAQPSLRTTDAGAVLSLIEAGKAVTVDGGVLTGELRLPLRVRVPLTLHNVTLTRPLVASSTSFEKLVDLRGSKLRAGADFSGATFDGPARFAGLQAGGRETVRFDLTTFHGLALFGGARFAGPVTFSAAEFGGVSRFRGASFGSAADFDSASFENASDFAATTFVGRASFNAASFSSVADFSGGAFFGQALFGAARFSQFADFSSRTFGGPTEAQASFSAARFDGGASFLNAEFDGRAVFDLARSQTDMVFDGVGFSKGASFSTARLLGSTTFSQADLRGLFNFDQAVVARLDLDGATLERDAAIVLPLPNPDDTTGRVDELRFDPSDIGHVVPHTDKTPRKEQQAALVLARAAAQRGGDTRAANEAYLRLRTLARHDEPAPLRALDWIGWWGAAGYFVAPWHPLVTLGLLLLLSAAVRVAWAWWKKLPRVRFVTGLRRGFAALWRLKIHEGSAAEQFEATIYKVVVVVLLLNLANVSSEVHDIVKGVLP